MSLNGDGVIMRNGRSTSQVSIYNYPEHLNPFYEDDQHKRLRFWQINKKGGDGEGRRNSFSLSGLKDVWTFKSFRLKKKSSTLGVNKTSESPPPLRRDIQYDSTQMDNAFNSYDRRSRYSSNNPSPANNNFQRNVMYRSSLQNMNSTPDSSTGFGLNRNDQYRRTIQTAGAGAGAGAKQPHSQQTLSTLPQSRRYVYGGSVTPQPLRSSEYGRGADSRDVLTRGSSQLSVASTNPFESDYEEDNEDVLVKTNNNKHLYTSTPVSKRTTPHKKRRAPAPPPLVHRVNGADISTAHSTESSQQNSHQRLHIDEEESREIANLTAEIESFVKTTNDEPPEGQQLNNKLETKLESSKQNGAVPKETKTTTTEVVEVIATPAKTTAMPATETRVTTVKTITTPAETTVTPVKTTSSISSETKTNTNAELRVEEPHHHHSKELNNLSLKGEIPIGSVECIHIHVDSPRATPERNEPSRVTSFRVQEQHQPATETITGKTSFTLASPPPTSPTGSRKDELTGKPQATKRTTITNTTTTMKTSPQQQQVTSNNRTNDLKITETITNVSNTTPTTRDESNSTNFKPPIAVKPNAEVTRTRISTLAEIHKPTKGILKHSVYESDSCTEPAAIKKLEIKETLQSTTTAEATKKDATDAKVLSSTITENKRVTPPPPSPSPPQVAGLKIVEPVEIEKPKQLLETTTTNTTPLTHPTRPPRTILLASTDEFEALYRPKPSTHMEWKKSTLAPLETNVPPEKRKSVKDIIESINRSQRLLNAAAHKDQAASLHIMRDAPASDSECGGNDGGPNAASFSSLTTTPQMQRKLTEPNNNFNPAHLDENHREVHRFYKEMLDLRTAGAGANGDGAVSDAAEDEEHDATKINNNNYNDAQQKLDNSEVFKKCIVTKEVYQACRESSPTASNLDWNPVPKPKRTKHMPEI